MTNKLNIIYCFTSANPQGSSVQDKVLAQIKALNEVGANCRGLFFTTAVKEETLLNENVLFVPVEKTKWKYFKSIAQRGIIIKTMFKRIDKEGNKFDLIYLRYPGASASLFRFARCFGSRLVSEHQSKEVVEIKESVHQNPFSLSPIKFLSWLQFQLLPILFEKTWGVLYARKVAAIVTVTNELAEYQKAKGCKVVKVIPNGIEVTRFPVRTAPVLNNEIILLFLKGTSTLASWNGLDRIIKSIDSYHRSSSSYRFRLLICGKIFDNEYDPRDYIEHLGYLRGKDLDRVFNRAHIAASTLCSFRRGLEESAILKTREYFARGIPFIYAYTDVDFDASDEVKMNTLRFPNTDELLDMERVIEFAIDRMLHPNHPAEMNEWAMKHLDYKIKMNELNNFLNKTIGEK